VLRRYPFTIVLRYAVSSPQVHPLRLKIDPGAKTTGLAVVNDASGEVVFAAELAHRGDTITSALATRRASRRSRRQRKTRYRKPRFNNRGRREGWLPPSLESRISHILTWVARLRRYGPIAAISQELVKFDMHAMQHPEMSGIEYQQGSLYGYEVREYLLEKWQRRCVYCGRQGVPLQVEHITPRAVGGTNRVSNLTLACKGCNVAKGAQDVRAFLAKKPALLAGLLAQAQAPLKDAAAVNATRWALYTRLQATGLSVEVGSGGRTKWNRTSRGLPKAHWVDAVCVGASTPAMLDVAGVHPLQIAATGHGSRQMCRMDRQGFPRTRAKALRVVYGFRTGDMVRAVVVTGKKRGIYVGRVAVRTTGSFNLKTDGQTVQGISHRNCTILHHSDGYTYAKGEGCSSQSLEGNGSAHPKNR